MSSETPKEPMQSPPVYHWSQILSPRFKLTPALFSGQITVTQVVHFRNQTPKATKPHPAFVIYDSSYIKYELLKAIAPLIAGELIIAEENSGLRIPELLKEKDFEDFLEAFFEDIYPKLTASLIAGVSDALTAYVDFVINADNIGVAPTPSPAAITKAFKLAQEMDYLGKSGF